MTGPIQRRAAVAVPVLFACAVLALGALRLAMASAVPDTGVQLRIVQANVAQHHKWDPEKRLMWFRRHLEFSATAHNPPPRVIVKPESAVPYDIDAQQEVRDYSAPAVPPGGALLVGGDRYELEREPPAATTRCSRSATVRRYWPATTRSTSCRSASFCRSAACSASWGSAS